MAGDVGQRRPDDYWEQNRAAFHHGVWHAAVRCGGGLRRDSYRYELIIVLALRTSFVALVYDQDDPVLDEILIWGGGMEPIESPADFQGGQTFTLVCFVYSETEDDIQSNLEIVWEQSTNEGATWTAKKNLCSSPRIFVI